MDPAFRSHRRSGISMLHTLFIVTISSILGPVAAAGAAAVQSTLPLNYIRLHGWLMWAGMGFCLPLGIILVRMTKGAIKRGESSRKIQALVYTHIAIQTLGVALSIVGAAIAFKKFDNKFRYTHERLGLSLFILAWLMPITGLLRPQRGVPARPIWYGLHWLVGTGTVILSFINIYIGMRVYEYLSSKSLRKLNILFSIQISVMGLVYLMQDRWGYLLEQREESKAVAPHSQISSIPKGTQSSKLIARAEA